MEVSFAPAFSRQLQKLETALQQETIETIDLLRNKENYRALEVHKLNGRMAERYSASVNYKYRIVFKYLSNTEVVLLAVGDHDVYK